MKKTCPDRGHRYSSLWPFCPNCFWMKFWWLIILMILVCLVASGVMLARPYVYCTEPYLGCQTFTPIPPTITSTSTNTPTPIPPSPTFTPTPTFTSTPTSTRTPTITPTPSELNWVVEDPDNTEGAGYYPSLAFDNNNQATIAYLHDSGDRLVIAREVGRSWDIFETDVMNGSRPGFYPALVADSKGDFHVVHYFLNDRTIAYMQGIGNTWRDVSTVAQNITISNMSRALTLAIGPNDHIYLAFLDTSDHTVSLASLSYRTWNVRGVGRGDSSSGSIALAVDESSQHLAFYTGDGLKYIRIRNGTTEDEQMIDTGRSIGLAPSMAIDSDGNLAIVYYAGSTIKLAIRNNESWNIYPIDDAIPATGDSRRTTSIAFSPDGMIHLCYFDAGNRGRLMYAMVNLSGNIVILQEVDFGGVGLLNSLAIDDQGMPAIAYLDQTGENLRFAHVEPRR